MISTNTRTNSRPKPRPREHTTKPRPATKTTSITLNILFGPKRSEIYHESEFCLDGTSGSCYRSKFLIENSPFVRNYVDAQVSGIQHHANGPYQLKLSGKINACLTGAKKYEIYPFTAIYNALHCCGTIRITIPLTSLPSEQQIAATSSE